MTDELKFPGAEEREALDERLTSLVRDLYAPPVGATGVEAYWTGLEQRIMNRVTTESPERGWLVELAPWARIGLAAAAAVFALASVVNRQMTDVDEQIAYEAVAGPEFSAAYDEPIAAQYVSPESEASALRYYLSN